jgi:hypothetical protein
MVKTEEIVLCFEVEVKETNLNLIKKLASTDMIDENPDEIQIGDKIDIEYVLAGEFTEFAVPMAMLFNSGLSNTPTIKVVRNEGV